MPLDLLIRKLAAALVLPPIGPLLLMLVGGLLVTRTPRLGRSVFFVAVLVTVVLSMPAVADWMQAPFEIGSPPFDVARGPQGAAAIVVLGGGRELGAREYGGETIDAKTLERVRYAARLARALRLPILVSGGKPDGGQQAEAELMAGSLKQDFGVPVRWIESASNDTIENATYSIRMLRDDKVSRVLLVTDVMHMRRARLAFESRGMPVVAAPTDFRADAPHELYHFLPSANAYDRSSFAIAQWLGEAWARLRDRPYADG